MVELLTDGVERIRARPKNHLATSFELRSRRELAPPSASQSSVTDLLSEYLSWKPANAQHLASVKQPALALLDRRRLYNVPWVCLPTPSRDCPPPFSSFPRTAFLACLFFIPFRFNLRLKAGAFAFVALLGPWPRASTPHTLQPEP